MTDQDRGAYTPPTDAPLSFDARQPVRGSRPVPITLILSAVILILLVVVMVVFYRSGVRQAGEAPQAVGTPMGAIKAAPPAEAQPEDPAAGLQIYKSESGQAAASAPTFAPPPETPQPRPTPPPAAAPSAPAPQVAALPPAKPAAAAAGLKPAQPVPPPTAPAAPAAKTPPAKAAPAPAAPAPKAAPAPATAGGAGVQIGAFSSQAQADEGFKSAIAIAPGLASGKGKRVEPVQKGSATLYRTTVTGFPSRTEATAFCNQLKAAGKSCFVK